MQPTTSTEGAALPRSIFGYDVVGKIGEGAGSTIYAVTGPGGQLYALKHVIRATEKHERYFEQLENEFEMSRLFRHPALRKYIELKIPKKLFGKPTEAALVMELIDGQPLDDRPPTSMPSVISIFARLASALDSLHRLKLIHCDTKPSNVIRCAGDEVRLIDFGQTCKAGTAKQRVQGTPDFIAPEQVKCRPVEVRTDVYNLGATLYWALTGRRVPTLLNVEKPDRHIVKRQEYPSPRDLNAGVPEALSAFVMQSVRYYPDDRPADMAAVTRALEECAMNAGS